MMFITAESKTIGHPRSKVIHNRNDPDLSTNSSANMSCKDLRTPHYLCFDLRWPIVFPSAVVSSKCFLETITCWIAAEHALHHAKSKISAVSDVFKMQNIQESDYVVLAGFHECLIKSGIGYLEQIHVFVCAEIDATSPILSELGRIFTPFSSILFTESSSYHLPVFKDDVNVWEFDELVYFTASKLADGGSSAKTPLTVISLAHTSPLADSLSDLSPGSGEGGKDEKQGSEKGKKGDRRNSDEADKRDKDLVATQKSRQEIEVELLLGQRQFPSKLTPRYT